MERETGFEPATPTLARSCSTTELFPPASGTVAQLRNPNHLAMVPGLCFRTPMGRFGRCPGTLGAHTGLSVPASDTRARPGTRFPRQNGGHVTTGVTLLHCVSPGAE